MNNELSYKAINGIVETINNGLDKAPDYVNDLIGRYAIYRGISYGAGLVVCLVAVIIGIILFNSGKKDHLDEWKQSCGCVLIVCGIIFSVLFLSLLLRVIYIPEIELINDIRL